MTSNSADAIRLEAVMDLTMADSLRNQFMERLSLTGNVSVDASAVDVMTSPCVQVLLSAAQSLAKHGRKIDFISPSEGFVATFDELGVSNSHEGWSFV